MFLNFEFFIYFEYWIVGEKMIKKGTIKKLLRFNYLCANIIMREISEDNKFQIVNFFSDEWSSAINCFSRIQ